MGLENQVQEHETISDYLSCHSDKFKMLALYGKMDRQRHKKHIALKLASLIFFIKGIVVMR